VSIDGGLRGDIFGDARKEERYGKQEHFMLENEDSMEAPSPAVMMFA